MGIRILRDLDELARGLDYGQAKLIADYITMLEATLREGANLYDGSSKGFALRSWQEHAKSVLGGPS